MDKQQGTKDRWSWLPAQMPQVTRRMAELRQQYGADWIKTCWHHGVVLGEPGWFFASEGALMVGTLWDDPDVLGLAMARITRTQALVVLRPQEAASHGA